MTIARVLPLLFALCLLAQDLTRADAFAEPTVFDHPPYNFGGLASDTDFLDNFGQVQWQQVADDFRLSGDATITRINWWGFYHLDNPPQAESFQVRIYNQRDGANLPGAILYSATLDNPSRTATGRVVAVTVLPDEYLFSAPLTVPFTAAANVPYWLEIVQLGDQTTHYRWEFSVAERTGHAFKNGNVDDWTQTLPNVSSDAAFQLLIPEPATLCLVAMGGAYLLRRPRRAQSKAELSK